MRFNLTYFFISITLFITEVLIALYIHDDFIRPFIGDVLVVILMYTSIQTVLKSHKIYTATGVFLFSLIIEFGQRFEMLKHLGWQNNLWARVILGTSFSWIDILCYAAGIGIILAAEFTPPRVK